MAEIAEDSERCQDFQLGGNYEVNPGTSKVWRTDSFSVLNSLLIEYETKTSSKFRTLKTDKLFGKEAEIDLKSVKHGVRWDDCTPNAVPALPADGTPFIIIGKKLFECQHGVDRDKKKKEDYKQKRLNQISIGSPRSQKQVKSVEIRNKLLTDAPIQKQHMYFVYLPAKEEHSGHVQGQVAGLIQPIDVRLRRYVQRMVSENGVTSTTQMRLLLQVYVKDVLFKDKPLPPVTSNRYWPSIRDIRNHMLLSLSRFRRSKVDQRWVWAFRKHRFNVIINTNNGVERQNKTLKYEYLETKKAKCLSQLLTVLNDKFIPDFFTRSYDPLTTD